MLAGLEAGERIRCVVDVHRVLRPGGRCLVIDPGQRTGLGGLVRGQAADADTGYVSRGGAVAALESGGFRAARLLAERDGIAFSEGVKGNTASSSKGLF